MAAWQRFFFQSVADTPVVGAKAIETNQGFGGGATIPVVPGARATETDVGSIGAPRLVLSGSQASSASSALAATSGPQVVLPSTRATSSGAAQAGSYSTVLVAAGAKASTTDYFPSVAYRGTSYISYTYTAPIPFDATGLAGNSSVAVIGARAFDTTEAKPIGISGRKGVTTETALPNQPRVLGGRAATHDYAGNYGYDVAASFDAPIQYNLADTWGTPTTTVLGTRATETSSAFTINLVVSGVSASVSSVGLNGSTVLATLASRGSTTDSAGAGAPSAVVAGATATGLGQGLSGGLNYPVDGSTAEEVTDALVDDAHLVVTINGSSGSTISTASPGSHALAVAGALAVGADAANAGAAVHDAHGSQATGSATGLAGTVTASTAGAQAFTTDQPLGSVSQTINGATAQDTASALAGSPSATFTGTTATTTASALAGAPTILVAGLAAETAVALSGLPVVTMLGANAATTSTASGSLWTVVVFGARGAETNTAMSGHAPSGAQMFVDVYDRAPRAIARDRGPLALAGDALR